MFFPFLSPEPNTVIIRENRANQTFQSVAIARNKLDPKRISNRLEEQGIASIPEEDEDQEIENYQKRNDREARVISSAPDRLSVIGYPEDKDDVFSMPSSRNK